MAEFAGKSSRFNGLSKVWPIGGVDRKVRGESGGGRAYSSPRPMARNLSRRCRRTVSRSSPLSSAKALATASPVGGDGGGRIAVGAADRLGDDAVDDAERGEVGRGDLHVGGGVLRLGGVAPQDRGRALRRDHAVDRVLQHQHAVGGGDRDRAARAAFAEDHRDVRHAEIEAGLGRARDRLGLAALLGVDAGIGAGGVDQRQHRDVEAVGHLHQPHRLAVALRPRHAEIVLEPALGRSSPSRGR